jgi:hypothetical protein
LGKNTRRAAIAGLLLVTVGSTVMVAGTLRISSPSFEQDAVIPPSSRVTGRERALRCVSVARQRGEESRPDRRRSRRSKAIKPDGQYLHWAIWDLSPWQERNHPGPALAG